MPETPWVVQVISLLIAPIAALVGVWLGKRLDVRSDENRWRRQARFDVYHRFLQASKEVDARERELLGLAVRGADDAHQDEAKMRLSAAADVMEREAAALELVASPSVLTAFLGLTSHARPTARPELTRRHPPPDAEQVAEALGRISIINAELVIAMRRDVALEPGAREVKAVIRKADSR